MFQLSEQNRSLLAMLPVSLLIVLFSFAKVEPEIVAGLDGSYMWALNYLLHANYNALRELVYPFGPLGFLKHPMLVGYNVVVALLFTVFVKLAFVYQMLLLGYKTSGKIKGSHLLIALIISYFSIPDFSIIGGCIVSLLLFYQTRKKYFFIWAVLLATVGLCIKISIGINAGAAVFVFLIADFYYHRTRIKIAWLAAIAFVVALSTGLLVFRSLPQFFSFLFNAVRLATGFGDALSLHPDNNWWLLGTFIVAVLAVPFVLKNRMAVLAFLLLMLPLFATWKHAMAREDETHARLLLFFLFIFWGIIGLTVTAKKGRLFVLASVCILAYYANMYNIPGFGGYKIEVAGIHNFSEPALEYQTFAARNLQRSAQNLEPYKLDSALLATIGNSAIDFYPFDFGFVPANGLNFRPRSTLQSGAFATWYDLEEASDFTAETGPRFVLLHLAPLCGQCPMVDGWQLEDATSCSRSVGLCQTVL
ncbi:MAG: hypothetical protein EOO03_13920 [Chitinophagaceae bacterium]|nr:MAG: hypothetical protein EOO03_13920 [Chitinophagaceae bacterium]